MNHRHARPRSRPRWWPFHRNRRNLAPKTSPPLDPDGRLAARLIVALQAAGMFAEPVGTCGVFVVHRPSGRRATVVLRPSDCWNGLAWHWLGGADAAPIGPAEAVRMVAGKITRAMR